MKEAGTCDAKEGTVIAEKSVVCEPDLDREEIRAADEEFTQHILDEERAFMEQSENAKDKK